MKFFFYLLLIVSSLEAQVVSRLRGQLGNQFFQIAAAIALAEENGCGVCFPDFDELDAPHLEGMDLRRNYEALFHRIPRVAARAWGRVQEATPYYRPIPYLPGREIDGFFQSAKYFEKYREKILPYFACPAEIGARLQERYGEILTHPKSVGLHVRTGYPDYLKHGGRGLFYQSFLPPDLEFYRKAMSYFAPDSLFVVCSDCIPWCKKLFASMAGNFLFVESGEALLDFYLLTRCKEMIIANSTFGWWAAYLNENLEKRVVCRKPFMAVGNPADYPTDLLCADWICIDRPWRPPLAFVVEEFE